MDFAISGTEIIFLIVAVLVTIPMLVFLYWVLKELRKENGAGQGKPGPGAS